MNKGCSGYATHPWVNSAELFIQSVKERSIMKNEYNKEKRIAIITLSVLAISLVGGLFWYLGTLGKNQRPVVQTESQTEQESTVTISEIKPENAVEPITSASETTWGVETASGLESIPEPESTPELNLMPELEGSMTAGTVMGDVQTKPSTGKPKTPEGATPPAEPPKDMPVSSVPVENPDADGQCQPEHTPQPEAEQPQVGEKQNGQIYVPGFGWIEDHGGGSEVHEAPNAGTGKPVGEM